LLILLDRQVFHQKYDSHPGFLDHEHLTVLMNNKDVPLNKINLPLSEAQADFAMDLRPYMDRSHLVVGSSFGYMETYNIFKVLGLRHLPVVDEHNQVVGILTRHDLLSYYSLEN